MREGKIGFLGFQGGNQQSGKDSASRTLELLEAKPGEPDAAVAVRQPYVLGYAGSLRLTILRRAPPEEDLWILERPGGGRATIAFRN